MLPKTPDHCRSITIASLLLCGLPWSAQALPLTDSAELFLNASWFQYDYRLALPARTEILPVSGTRTNVGIATPNWLFSWSPSAANGDIRVELDDHSAKADYQSDSTSLAVTRYFLPWYVRLGYSQTDTRVDIRLNDGRFFSDEQQEATDWSAEAGKSWVIDQWVTRAYAGALHSSTSTDQRRAAEPGQQLRQQEEITENYLTTGASVSYHWQDISLTPTLGLDYQRRISSDGDQQTALSGHRGRPLGRQTGAALSSGLVNWSAVYGTLDYEFSHLGISLSYQYELNDPNQDYTNVAFYLLF